MRVLLFAVSTSELQKQLADRVGQCVLTSPGSACYAGLAGEESLRLGNALRYFGDGWQISKRFGGKHYWRIPVMDGEFVCEATTGLTKEAVGGGNLLIMGRERAGHAGGGRSRRARRSSKVADVDRAVSRRHRALGLEGRLEVQVGVVASTNDAYCPTLRGAVSDRARSRTSRRCWRSSSTA